MPEGKKPQEKTLRKLYLYTEGNVEDIAELINLLKEARMTVAWTNKTTNATNIRELINRIQ